ncbi:hypothetical protein E4U56_005824 [Claviceps arundinis]|uniref:U1-C C2H2-type zinc finger domain-containing protein n=1 Tax=Claviceps arundinis TaxID=1623583 RepID=A0A9P7MWE7_9HYPO|nr:hypothetical protein E4U56_005824 [Claviceps arundinis]
MTEYWKNSPNYWCKQCSVYVRDTKLERQNHEATARHQNAIKRSLRDLHRTHDWEQREKERARREIDRLNGVVARSKLPHGSEHPPEPAFSASSSTRQGSSTTDSALKQQREQLAQMGVSIPSALLPDMAMPGEWTVTNTRVIDDHNGAGNSKDRLAMGVRKRGGRGWEGEEEKEEQDAVRGLFKKPKRWGRDTRALEGEGEDAELDALLSGTVVLKGEQQQQQQQVKEEKEEDHGENSGDIKAEDEEEKHDVSGVVKDEQDLEGEVLGRDAAVKAEQPAVKIKREEVEEEEEEGGGGGGVAKGGEAKEEILGIAPVVFKKRKAKGLRTKAGG